MTNREDHTPSKRSRILTEEEIEALYGRPCFTAEDRTHYFALTQPEHDRFVSFGRLHVQIYFILQLGYFKAKQIFFAFTFDEVADDVAYIRERYFSTLRRLKLRPLNKRTILKQRQSILALFQYRLGTATDRQRLFLHAQQAARISSKPIYVFRELLDYLTERRIVSPGYSVLQEAIIGKALLVEEQRLIHLLQTRLTPMDCIALDGLFNDTDGRYAITLLKRQPKDFSLGEMRREIARGDQLSALYQLATTRSPSNGSTLTPWHGVSTRICVRFPCRPPLGTTLSLRRSWRPFSFLRPRSRATDRSGRSRRQTFPPAAFRPVTSATSILATRQAIIEIIPDRYEFLIYRLLRNGLLAGDLFCRHSVRFRSFEDDLLDDQQWANKDALIAETGRLILAQPHPGASG